MIYSGLVVFFSFDKRYIYNLFELKNGNSQTLY